MIEIKKFEDRNNKDVNDFIISIYVDEFGYEVARNELENQDNSIFIKNGNFFWVAFNENSEIIGTIAVLKHENNNMELKKFYVRKDYRGKGVSNELFDKAIDYCKANDSNRLFLWTNSGLESGIRYYLKKRIY